MSDCVRCARPVHDTGYLDTACSNKLIITLLYAAMNARELDTTIARQDRVSRGVSPHRTQTPNDTWQHGTLALTARPLPLNLMAVAQARKVAAITGHWVRHITTARGVDGPMVGLPHVLSWLAGQVRWLRHTDQALRAYDDLIAVDEIVRRVVDSAPPQVLVGECECGVHLYGVKGRAVVTCHACGLSYDIERAREALRARAEGMLFTAAELATLAVHLGLSTDRLRTRKLLNQLSKRGLLLPHGDIGGSPSYRCGEALARLAERIAPATA